MTAETTARKKVVKTVVEMAEKKVALKVAPRDETTVEWTGRPLVEMWVVRKVARMVSETAEKMAASTA